MPAANSVTMSATVGIALLLANYLVGVVALKTDPAGEGGNSASRSKRYFVQGVLLSDLLIALLSIRLQPGDRLMQVTYFLLAFCYVISGVMFGVGIVFVDRLWQELVPQFPGHSDRAVDESVPKSVWWLAVSFGGFLALGALIPLIDKLPMLPKLLASGIARELIFGVLAIILYRLIASTPKIN